MIVIVDERETVSDGYASWFDREGVSATGLGPRDFYQWVETVSEPDISAVEAFLLGSCPQRQMLSRKIRGRSSAAVIALNEHKSLEETLELFAAGVDDVVRKPIHVREILARIEAIRRRSSRMEHEGTEVGDLRVFFNGRDPEVRGEVLPLPRRERRILEYLVMMSPVQVSSSPRAKLCECHHCSGRRPAARFHRAHVQRTIVGSPAGHERKACAATQHRRCIG